MIGIGINTTLRAGTSSGVSLPVAIAATGIGETSFTANWNPYPGAVYYLLDVSTSSSFSTFVYQDQYTTSTSYVVIGLSANTTYYYRVRANTEYDADAQAFFNRVTTAGGTLTTTEMNAVNTLVGQIKNAGIWTKMKAIYPMVGASAAACAQNLKSSSFTGTFSSGWTFASTGVKGNGTSAYMDTTCIPNVSLNQDSQHLCYYSRDNFNNSLISCGGGPYHQNLYTGGSFYGILSSSSFTAISIATTKGMSLISRTSSGSGATSYWNNTNIGNDGIVSSSQYNYSLYVNARNSTNTGGFFSSNECAFASIGDGLTNTQASNFYTAVQTFNQTLNRQVGAQIVSDADAQAYINRVYTAGGTLTNTEANAVNQLVIDMKAAGIWTAMKAVYPMVGASAAACAQNLKSSSFTGTFSSGWTFASTGVTGNGTSAYFRPFITPSIDLLNANFHVSYYSRTNIDANTIEMGCGDGSGYFSPHLRLRFGGNQARFICGNTTDYGFPASVSNSDSRGLFTGTILSTSDRRFYKNSSLIQSNTSTITNSLYSGELLIGAYNQNTTSLNVAFFSTKECAFSSIGDGLTDTQAASLYTCVQTMNTTLSRNV